MGLLIAINLNVFSQVFDGSISFNFRWTVILAQFYGISNNVTESKFFYIFSNIPVDSEHQDDLRGDVTVMAHSFHQEFSSKSDVATKGQWTAGDWAFAR